MVTQYTNTKRAEVILETLIKTQSLYLALFDLASPVNAPGMVGSIFQAADARAKESGQTWAAQYLIQSNAALASRALQGEFVVWILLFDGVFKVVVEVLPPDHAVSLAEQEESTPSDPGELLWSHDHHQLLWCPSGKFTVACLGALGKGDLAPTLEVEPGAYRVRLKRDFDQEDEHALLKEPSDYPPTEGPDWRIQLQLRNVNRP